MCSIMCCAANSNCPCVPLCAAQPTPADIPCLIGSRDISYHPSDLQPLLLCPCKGPADVALSRRCRHCSRCYIETLQSLQCRNSAAVAVSIRCRPCGRCCFEMLLTLQPLLYRDSTAAASSRLCSNCFVETLQPLLCRDSAAAALSRLCSSCFVETLQPLLYRDSAAPALSRLCSRCCADTLQLLMCRDALFAFFWVNLVCIRYDTLIRLVNTPQARLTFLTLYTGSLVHISRSYCFHLELFSCFEATDSHAP